MEPITITKSQARKIILNAAGLTHKNRFGSGVDAVYSVIDHLGFVQLDTNYVVERAHHYALAARVPGYQPEWLTELCEAGRVFEYFTSDAGYLPMHDFRFSLPVKESFEKDRKPLSHAETRLMDEVLNRIEREGPLMVGDFENDRLEASSGWWDWRPAKIALERLFQRGKLMITRTGNFQKQYNLPLELVPADTDLTVPSAEEFARHMIVKTLRVLGIGSVKEMAWRTRMAKNNALKTVLPKMLEEGTLRLVTVDGLKTAPLYMLSDQQADVEPSGEAFILSPFDILNVFRHRLKDFFEFAYQIECFAPAQKRKYGYFSLPVLIGDRFIARMDAKADRKQKTLIIHNFHFEPIEIDLASIQQLIISLKEFVVFNSCRNIVFSRSNNPQYLEQLKNELED